MEGGVTVTVWFTSSMSSWATSSFPFWERLSKATSCVPDSRARESKVKVTLTVPLLFSAVKVVSAVTALPSTSRGSPVALSMSVPVTVYSLPGTRPSYETVSTTVASLSVTTFLSPSTPSTAVVPMVGFSMVTVWFMSSMSAWTASSRPFWLRVSKATSCVPSSRAVESKVKVTSTVPSAVSGVKVASAVTALPSTSRASPVALS